MHLYTLKHLYCEDYSSLCTDLYQILAKLTCENMINNILHCHIMGMSRWSDQQEVRMKRKPI